MKILSIDTSSNLCSVSLLENDSTICELLIDDNKTHSENLMPLIQRLFTKTNIGLPDLELIACNKGPGSFTGIRIGIATAKAIGEVAQIPVIGVSSLDCLAYNIENGSKTICSLIDAKNNQVYCGIFDSTYNLQDEYIADDIDNVINSLSNYSDITFVGDGALAHKDKLQQAFKDAKFWTNNNQHSSNIGKCAFSLYKTGFTQSADTILPMYLRKSQAERMKEKNG